MQCKKPHNFWSNFQLYMNFERWEKNEKTYVKHVHGKGEKWMKHEKYSTAKDRTRSRFKYLARQGLKRCVSLIPVAVNAQSTRGEPIRTQHGNMHEPITREPYSNMQATVLCCRKNQKRCQNMNIIIFIVNHEQCKASRTKISEIKIEHINT